MPASRALIVATFLMTAAAAQAADLPGRIVLRQPLERNAPCADRNVLEQIAERFAWAERTTWHRGFVIASIQNGRPTGRPFFEPGIIHREYCRADSVMTNDRSHAVYFTIEFGVGFASIGNYIDFCMVGLDPWHVHDEACRTVR